MFVFPKRQCSCQCLNFNCMLTESPLLKNRANFQINQTVGSTTALSRRINRTSVAYNIFGKAIFNRNFHFYFTTQASLLSTFIKIYILYDENRIKGGGYLETFYLEQRTVLLENAVGCKNSISQNCTLPRQSALRRSATAGK